MVAFVNTFLSYGALMLVIVAVAAAGFVVGMVLRKNKDAKKRDSE